MVDFPANHVGPEGSHYSWFEKLKDFEGHHGMIHGQTLVVTLR